MIKSKHELPFNPFVNLNSDSLEGLEDGIQVLVLPPKTGLTSADNFDQLAHKSDWTDPEKTALRVAAEFVRWSAETHELTEDQVIRNRTSFTEGIGLIVSNETEITGIKEK